MRRIVTHFKDLVMNMPYDTTTFILKPYHVQSSSGTRWAIYGVVGNDMIQIAVYAAKEQAEFTFKRVLHLYERSDSYVLNITHDYQDKKFIPFS